MRHLLYLMFQCDVDVMESLGLGEFFFLTQHSRGLVRRRYAGDERERSIYLA